MIVKCTIQENKSVNRLDPRYEEMLDKVKLEPRITSSRKFFFWGIFTDEFTVRRLLGKPKSFTGNVKMGEVSGVLVDFSNLNKKDFLQMLGSLSLVEISGFRLVYLYPNDKEQVMMYLPKEYMETEDFLYPSLKRKTYR